MREDDVAKPLRKVVKRFGIKYGKHTQWFRTEAGRDESMDNWERKTQRLNKMLSRSLTYKLEKVER